MAGGKVKTPDRIAIVLYSLGGIIVAVTVVLLAGLFDPMVDNEKIFAIIGPAFHNVVGCFVGILGGKALSDSTKDTKP